MLEDVQCDDGIEGTVELIADHVQAIDRLATRALEVDECLGDVRTPDSQPGLLEDIGIPPGAGADLQRVAVRDHLGQARQRSGEDAAAGGVAGVLDGDLLV